MREAMVLKLTPALGEEVATRLTAEGKKERDAVNPPLRDYIPEEPSGERWSNDPTRTWPRFWKAEMECQRRLYVSGVVARATWRSVWIRCWTELVRRSIPLPRLPWNGLGD